MSKLTIGAVALLAGASFAQQSAQIVPITSTVKDAGTFHVASGTWSRDAAQAGFGPKVLFCNDINTGFFGNQAPSEEWTDNGRIPSTSGHANAKADCYDVNGFEFAYCSSEGPAGTALLFAFYECYSSCTDPSILTPALAVGAIGPGSAVAGTAACWLVTFDLCGTSLNFELKGDCDGVFDGITSIDTFGWTNSVTDAALTDVSAGAMGPFLNGDPNNFPAGDGTYYQNPSLQGSGLDCADQFWLFDRAGITATGCYWFGGYAGGNPWSCFHLRIFGDNIGDDDDCAKFCSSNPNSTGSPALIGSTDGCDSDGDGMISVEAGPVPNQPGIFFSGTTQPGGGAGVPFGNGLLCTAGQITRHGVVVASGNLASQTIDISGLSAPSHMQFWYRDPAGGGAFYNTSDAMTTLP